MQDILSKIEISGAQFARHPLFDFLRDRSVPPRTRFGFVRNVAPWVLGFSDLCQLVLRDDSSEDPWQMRVNQHAAEDDGHWKWFLQDLNVLGDGVAPFSETVQFLWSSATEHTRRLTLKLTALGVMAAPLERIVMLEAIETINKAALDAARVTARDWHDLGGAPLAYFGELHGEVEDHHSLDEDDARNALRSVELSADTRAKMESLVDQVFAAFDASMTELLAACRTA